MPKQHLRRAQASMVLALLAGCTSGEAPTASPVTSVPTTTAVTAAATSAPNRDREFRRLERTFASQLGVFGIDTGTKRSVTYRADQRFAYASTFKALAVAAVLDQNSDQELDDIVTYTKKDLVSYSPITERHVGTGMTLREISAAAIRYSDNTAGNLLLRDLGGPRGLSTALRRIGDDVTHVDRIETSLNTANPGDVRDTSTPRALGLDLQKFALGNVLNAKDRALLTGWLRGNTTGANLIRAGVPKGWTVGDKTGSARYGTRNDIAVLWPPKGAPIVLAIMSNRKARDAEYDEALIAQAAAVAIDALR